MRHVAIAVVALFCLGLLVPGDAPGDGLFATDSQAQDPVGDLENTTRDLQNTTNRRAEYDLISILASPMATYLDIPERGVGVFPVQVTDSSVQGTEQYSSAISVTCEPTPIVADNETVKGWAVSRTNSPTLYRNTQAMTAIQVVAGPFASPEFYRVHVVCEAGHPLNRVVGEFNLTAHVKPYVYMVISSIGIPEKMAPFEKFTHRVAVTNNGNQPEIFYGSIDAPDGWTVSYPRNIFVQPGETEIVEITGHAPRDKIVYLSGSGTMFVKYSPATAPGKGQTTIVPLQVQGVYMHPALVPLVILAVIIFTTMIFLAVLTRRAIEEQILGKPVPPWRIPVEREYLQQLQREDPDQYYIVRYYLMVEEHESALLWFSAYKQATKKDRKRERKWYKVKAKQERKIVAVEKDHTKVEKKWARKAARIDKKRDRKIRKLERKLRRSERKAQRGAGKKHRKRVKKIEKKHAKKAKKINKKHERLVAKESKRVDKKNRKLAKKGEELLPLPEIPPPEIEPPELPELEEVKEVPLAESRFAGRADKVRERAERKRERLRLRSEKAIGRDRLKTDAKVEKLESKIPPEPDTHLYDVDEYVPADEVVVEDDRPFIAKLLHIPTLEERDRIRRRRAVHRARLKEAKAAKDPQRIEKINREQKEELAALKQERRDELASSRAGDEETARMKKEQRRRAKEAAKEKRAAAKSDRPAPAGPTGEEPVAPEEQIKPGLPIRLRGKKEAAPSEAETEAEPAPTEEAPKERSGFKARFQRKKAEGSADSEEAKKEPESSAEETTARERS